MTASDAPEGDETDSSPVLPTHRRSTFEPPAAAFAAADGESVGTDDDALAAALAEELGRVTRTGSIPIQTVPASAELPETFEVPETPVFDVGVDAGNDPVFPFEPEPVVTPDVPVWSLDDAAVGDPVFPVVAEPAEPAPAEPVPAAAPVFPSLASPFTPPVRQSLPDEALVQWIGDGATLEAMEQLEREASLRQQDAAAFAEWEQSMYALGTTEALDALDHARTGFADVLTTTGAITTVSPASSPAEEPPTAADPQPSDPHPVDPHPVDPHPAESPAEPVAPQQPGSGLSMFDYDDAGQLNAAQLADLALAPAPLSMPYSDIPPPSVGEAGDEWVLDQGQTISGSGDGIPALIEPDAFAPGDAQQAVASANDFDSFLAGAVTAGPAEDEPPIGAEYEATDEGQPFPLAVYEQGEVVPETIDLEAPRAFRVELAGLEPTPVEQRVGRSARLFWMWFAANSSVISVGLGAVVLSLGMSLRQAVIATLIGVSVSSLPLGIGALAGKRSGQPTMVVSRATFGLIGNGLPALVALLTRIFWGAVLLWLLALGVAEIGGTDAVALDPSTLALIGLGAAVLLVALIAFFGYGLIARVQAVVTIVATVLVVGFIMLSWPAVDLRAAMRVADGDWMLLATGAVLVFSVLGLAWAMSSADVARYQNPHSSSGGSMLWSWAGVALPAFALIAYGSLLAASSPDVLEGLLEQPIETLTLLAPAVFVYPMLAVIALGLLSGAIMTVYSGGFALQALGVRAPRSIVVIIVAVLTGAAAAGILVAVTGFDELVRDLVTTVAVPVAAWVGVFSAELMMRSRRFHSESLLRRGGVYADFRWVNLTTLLVASAVGYAFTNASVAWLSWQGFGWPLIGAGGDSVLAETDLGVAGALVLALLVTVATAKPGINTQERDSDGEPESADS